MHVHHESSQIVLLMALLGGICTGCPSFAQSDVKLNFSPIFILAKGFGATLDFPVNDKNDMRFGVAIINLESLKFFGAGIGVIHNFDSYEDNQYFYMNYGLAAGRLNVEIQDESLISGTLFEAHTLIGRQIERENGLRFRFGAGLGYGQFTENSDGALSLGDIFFGVQPRIEFQVGFSPNAYSPIPPRRW